MHLAPFDRETLQHFVFLERPDGSDEIDGKGFAAEEGYRRTLGVGQRLMPSGQDYETVGELYHALDRGMKHLSERDGEARLFVGGRDRQIGDDLVGLPGLRTIGGLDDALAAIETIVEQGEGAPAHSEDGHYQAFVRIRAEYDEILADDPTFVPARPVATSPVMRRPVTAGERVWVDKPGAVAVMDFANALYGQMLRLLSQAFGREGPAKEKRTLIDAGVELMFALTAAGEQLTRMQANDRDACNAGMSFAMLRPLTALPTGNAEWTVLDTRFAELERAGESLRGLSTTLDRGIDTLAGIAARFSTSASSFVTSGSADSAAAAAERLGGGSPAGPTSGATAADGMETVEGRDVTLAFDGARCIHARHCVTGAPETFLANVEGEWLHPDRTDADRLATVASMCPSGAIHLVRKDGRADEGAPPVNLCHTRQNGPLAFRAELLVDGEPAGYRATLCRCGRSSRKPFCDGSHVAAGFEASGEPATVTFDPLARRDGPLEVRGQRDGPLVVAGPLEICAGTGRVVKRVETVRLCRCGGSANKPFCDNTHVRIGFRSEPMDDGERRSAIVRSDRGGVRSDPDGDRTKGAIA